jgi:hypothetical protein
MLKSQQHVLVTLEKIETFKRKLKGNPGFQNHTLTCITLSKVMRNLLTNTLLMQNVENIFILFVTGLDDDVNMKKKCPNRIFT